MDNIQEYLKYLLRQEKWTHEEKAWMLEYLDKDDLTDLERVAAEEFQTDLQTMKLLLERKMSERILDNIHRQIGVTRFSVFYSMRRYRWAIAAAVLVIIAGAAWFLKDNVSPPVQMQQAATTLQERKTIQLPDGSVVSLEPQSVLHFPADFNDKTRTVTLEGEAFFEVTNEAEHPFVVQTKDFIITVLGTSFNVVTYPADLPRVVVVSGRVKIWPAGNENEDAAVVAGPEQGVVLNLATGKLELKTFPDEARYCRQRQKGAFVYEGEAIAKVLDDLHMFYRSPLTLQGDFSKCRFYGTIYTSDQLEKSLHLLALSMNASVQKNSGAEGYTISGGNCR